MEEGEGEGEVRVGDFIRIVGYIRNVFVIPVVYVHF